MKSATPVYLVEKLGHLRRHVSLGPHDTSTLETWQQLIPSHLMSVFSHLVDKDNEGGLVGNGGNRVEASYHAYIRRTYRQLLTKLCASTMDVSFLAQHHSFDPYHPPSITRQTMI